MSHRATVDVLQVVVGSLSSETCKVFIMMTNCCYLGEHQAVALLLLQARGEGEWVLAPGNVALVVGHQADVRLLKCPKV